jgi:hypothetical protein
MATFMGGMFHRAQVVLGLAPAAPPPTPAERAERQAVKAKQAAERAWAARQAQIAEERRAEYAAREAAEQARLEAARERAALLREEMLDACARYGYWWPTDRYVRREPARGWLGRLLGMLGG